MQERKEKELKVEKCVLKEKENENTRKKVKE